MANKIKVELITQTKWFNNDLKDVLNLIDFYKDNKKLIDIIDSDIKNPIDTFYSDNKAINET